MDHAVRHFQEELEALHNRLLEMGGLAEERVRVAVDGGVVVNVLGSGRIDAGRGSVRVEAAISTAGLSAGAHTVTIRARDMAGRWSATATATLVVAP